MRAYTKDQTQVKREKLALPGHAAERRVGAEEAANGSVGKDTAQRVVGEKSADGRTCERTAVRTVGDESGYRGVGEDANEGRFRGGCRSRKRPAERRVLEEVTDRC